MFGTYILLLKFRKWFRPPVVGPRRPFGLHWVLSWIKACPFRLCVRCKDQYRNPKAQRGILLPAAISMSSTARAALPLSFCNTTNVYSNKQILLKNVESIKQDWSCAAVILRLASIFTKKILRLVQLYAIIAFITLMGCGADTCRKRKLLDGGWQYSLDKQHGLLLAAISKRN